MVGEVGWDELIDGWISFDGMKPFFEGALPPISRVVLRDPVVVCYVLAWNEWMETDEKMDKDGWMEMDEWIEMDEWMDKDGLVDE